MELFFHRIEMALKKSQVELLDQGSAINLQGQKLKIGATQK
jgi:hypothetical protein